MKIETGAILGRNSSPERTAEFMIEGAADKRPRWGDQSRKRRIVNAGTTM
jgi:hypothetical protein